MKTSTREILERYDEPGAYEFPRAFRYPELEARATEVAHRLIAIGQRVTIEGAAHNQDASFSVAILLHNYEKSVDRLLYQPNIRFSNFGNLVSVTWDEQIPETDLKRIVQELEACGFTFIPESELDCDYDGIMTDKKTFSSWWIRYFDWI